MKRFVLAAAMISAATPVLAMNLSSSDVKDGAVFDTKFVCAKFNGTSVSPQLSWSGVPTSAKSLAVTMFDPDAGTKGFWHWLVADIPTSATGLPTGAGSEGGALPAGATPLPNGAGKAAYAGPCPPTGTGPHHYQITLYALPDAKVEIPSGMKAPDIGALLDQVAIEKVRITPVFGK